VETVRANGLNHETAARLVRCDEQEFVAMTFAQKVTKIWL
jgi:hypothetical protein